MMNETKIRAWEARSIDSLEDREVVLSISGGKDSTAMALLFSQTNIRHRRVFIDTGWEHPSTKEYLLEYLQPILGPIEVISSPVGGMKDLVRKMNRFPSRGVRFCTGEIKLLPMRIYLEEQPYEMVNAVGVRADESRRRAMYPEWEYSTSLRTEVWRPILTWKMEDVIDMHQRFQVRPNPLYLMGVKRVGCWPCIFSSRAEVRLLAEEDPHRIDEIRSLEEEINARRKEKDPEAKEVSWFSAGRESLPIDQAVKWAFAKGSKEILLTGDKEAGCMRWGMCSPIHPLKEHQQSINAHRIIR